MQQAIAANDFLAESASMPKLNFDGQNTLYATHGLHAYAAKCPPQLVNYALKYYSKPRNIVLDPMMGSGTTLVESKLLGRHSIGTDIDPLARLIAEVKSTPVRDDLIVKAFDELMKNSPKKFNSNRPMWRISSNSVTGLPANANMEYWFSYGVARSLANLSERIRTTRMPSTVRNFFWVAFSSLILAKTSVANARDIVHSRHHFLRHEAPPDVFERFSKRVGIMRKQMADFSARLGREPVSSTACLGDARKSTHDDESVDLVFTSPPYVTALDYTRSHFLAVAWLSQELGLSLSEYKERGKDYIGTERKPALTREGFDSVENLKSLKWVLASLRSDANKQALFTERYFVDMYAVMKEISRVLRPKKHAILVVCPSHIRKVEVPSHEILMEMGEDVGLSAKNCYSRTIDARRRLLPFVKHSFGRRMSTEYVLIFKKG